jgi:tRNA dimethylallyltransferase
MINGEKPRIIVIVGPTASGKSDMAIKIAKERNGELVSADSRQVYIGMDVVTAKLTPPEGIKQWLVDVVEPDEVFTLADYQKLAFEAIDDILSRGKLPILVGGTAMYVDAVIENWVLPASAEKERIEVQQIIEKEGLESAMKLLQEKDQASANTIDLENPRRVARALEYVLATGESFVHAQDKALPKYEVEKIGLEVEPEVLKERMKKRVEWMFENGAVEETKKMLEKYSLDLPAMSGIGYKEIKEYIGAKISKEQAIEKITTATYQYSRRQMTWWKRDKNIKWSNNSI